MEDETMKRLFIILPLLLSLLMLALPLKAEAQSEAPEIIKAINPVNSEIRTAVQVWLADHAPAPARYWAISYVEPRGDETLVSIIALDIESPNEKWYFTENAVWVGTVIVHADMTVEMYSTNEAENVMRHVPKLAMPVLGPGGGSYVRFPWQAGGTMMYGPRAVHAAGYSTSGMQAVDFVGGDDMGSGVAPPRVYASTGGVIDSVCPDGTSTAVRVYNESANDYFIYAHLANNANLTIDHQFSAGQLIGSLVYGTFDDDCGWASQKDNHYHLHYGFSPSGGSYRMENCILSISNATWQCGTQTVKTGQFLKGGGGVYTGGDSGGMAIAQPGFWDYMITGFITIWDRLVIKNLPAAQNLQYTYVIYSTVKLVAKIAFVLVRSNVNLFWFFACLFVALTIKLLFGIVELVFLALRTIKALPAA
jgi:hypothetical protein